MTISSILNSYLYYSLLTLYILFNILTNILNQYLHICYVKMHLVLILSVCEIQ